MSQASTLRRNPIAAGERHGRLVAIEFVEQDQWGAARWRFHCDCGNENYVTRPDQVRRGIIVSCGCQKRDSDINRRRATLHGHTADGKRTTEYRSWRNMLDRCNLPTSQYYTRYGGRGIKVCERWHAFENFLADMGKKPTPKHTIGRRDNDGHYCKENCTWESSSQQMRNTSATHWVTYHGKRMSLAEACERQGISRNVVDARLRRGLTVEQALTKPIPYPKTTIYWPSLGERLSLTEACRRQGISDDVVKARLRYGWAPDEALTTAVGQRRPR